MVLNMVSPMKKLNVISPGPMRNSDNVTADEIANKYFPQLAIWGKNPLVS